MSRRRLPFWPLLFVLATVSVFSVIASLAFGSERIPLGEVVAAVTDRFAGEPAGRWDVIIWELRLPRALLALVVGAGLAIAGAGMQTLVRNTLADPYLLGISSGASVGATAALTTGALAGLGLYAVSTGALLGAVGSALLIWLIATAQGGLTPIRLVLHPGQSYQQKIDILKANPASRNLEAVKKGRFVNLPYAMWVSGPLNIDAAEWVRAAVEHFGIAPKSSIFPTLEVRQLSELPGNDWLK